MTILRMFAPLLICVAAASAQTPMDGSFTYQGRLNQGDVPVNGGVDLQFHLFDVESAGAFLDDNPFNTHRNFSENTLRLVDEETRRFIDDAYRRALDVLTEHREILDLISDALVTAELLEGEDLDEIIRTKQIPDRLRENGT